VDDLDESATPIDFDDIATSAPKDANDVEATNVDIETKDADEQGED